MTWRTRTAVGRGAWWAAAAVVGVVCLGGCSRAVELAPGQVVEGELEPEGDVTYGLRLAENDYARVRVVPLVTDRMGEVSAVASAPDDRLIIEAVGIRNEAGGIVAWVAPADGVYRLRLSNPDPNLPLRYRVTRSETRAAHPEDRYRAAAEAAAAEASRWLSRGEGERAVEARERALRHWQQVGRPVEVIAALLDLADIEASSNPNAALAHCKEALDLAAEFPDWRLEALERKGRLLVARSDCMGAKAAFEDAKTIALERNDLAAVSSAAYQTGWLLKRCGSLDRAEEAFEEALHIGRRAGEDAVQANSLRELAMIAKWRGDLETAHHHIASAVPLAEASGDREILAAVLHEFGNVEKSRGKLIDARTHYQRCLELNESLGKPGGVIPPLLTLGVLSLDLRRPEEARTFLERALVLAEDLGESTWVAEAERELGATYERLYLYDRAEEFYRRSLATAELIGRDSGIAAAYFRLGHLLVLRERFGEAIPPLFAALELQGSFGDKREMPLTLRALGVAHGRLNEKERALEYLSQALEIQREQRDGLRIAWTLRELARVQAEEDPIAARRTLEEAIGITQEIRSGLDVDSLRVDFFQGSRRLYDLYVDLLIRMGDLSAAFEASEEGRARSLLDLLIEAQVDPRAEIGLDLQREVQQTDLRIARLQQELREAVASGSDQRADEIRIQLDQERRASDQLVTRIRRQSRRYRELSAPVIRSLQEVQSSLPSSRVLLEYWLGGERSYVFVVTRDGATALPLPPERDLSERVQRLRATLVSMLPASQVGVEAHSLFRELVAPALEIADDATGLIIVPEGPLNLLPFEALVTELPAAGSRFSDLDYLIRRVETTYAPSATVLASLGTGSDLERPTDARAPKFVAFADPDNGGRLNVACPTSGEDPASSGDGGAGRGPDLPSLRGGRQEVSRIARPYGRSARVFVGADATEKRVVSDPEVAIAERLHFAVHGMVCESRPETSGLILARDDEAAEDGILETREIFDLRLRADLVVLSACDTGLGKVVRGEGVVGLTRAFFYAGVPSLVVSLWKVPDLSTADLMTTFYRRLDAGEDTAEALRGAKLDLIDAGVGRAAPLYWAPFILVGSRGGTESPEQM